MINILLIASIFGFVLSTLLFLKKTTNTNATFFLGSFYFILSIYALQTYIVDGGNLDKTRWFFIWPLIPYNAICIPIYYYFQAIFKDKIQWKKRQILLFVPLLLSFIDVGYIYLYPDTVYTPILNDAIVNPEDRLEVNYLLLHLDQHVFIRHVWHLGVLLIILPQLLNFLKLGKEDRLKGILNKWLRLFWGVLFIFAISAILYVLEKMGVISIFNNFQHGELVSLTLYLTFLSIGVLPVYFPSILQGYPRVIKVASLSQKERDNEVSELKFGLQEEEITTKLELLNQKKLYLEQDFNLTKCAQEMEMPAHHISYFLKSYYGMSFSSYKNNLRMEDAKKLIEEGYLKNNTIEALAGECGFATRTSFSKTFKNETELSPSQYALDIK
ncbi:AraC family transcriptional regulator [uncultured Marixanthomonas sp.]|uniref:helix-turn-helix domain-containing protein n=1 Tax=uncultured Marixanthomonas sp. TaxID=757245 RepID=UPI0030DB2C80